MNVYYETAGTHRNTPVAGRGRPRPHSGARRRDGRLQAVRVYVGSDHAGFELKNHLVSYLEKEGHEVTDVGPFVYDAADDYPPFCIETARRVVADEGSLGLVIGGSGNGEQIAANKVRGARAALAWKPEIARLAREHNHAQLIGIGARMHTVEEAVAIVDAFLATPVSSEERHQRRIEQLAEYERTGTTPPLPSA
jgi:ribose 5-phosphate isomerase B